MSATAQGAHRGVSPAQPPVTPTVSAASPSLPRGLARTAAATLTCNATVTGLQPSYNATVGRELRIDFETGKFTPRVSVPASSLGAIATRTGTMATLSVTPARAGDFSVTLSFSRPAETSRSGSSKVRAAYPGQPPGTDR